MASRPAEIDALSAFRAENDGSTAVLDRPGPAMDAQPSFWHVVAAFAAGAAIISGVSVVTLRDWIPLRASAPQLATLTVESRPAGADVLIDGQLRGTAPLNVSLAAGPHRIALRRGSDERGRAVTLAAGAVVTDSFEFAPEPPVAPTAKISIVTDPPGARVTIDGEAHGTSPVTIAEIAAGEHKIIVTGDAGSAERNVRTQAGDTASVVFSLPKAAAPLAGWLAIAAPFDIRVMEDDTVVGAGRSAKIMMPAGRHTVALMNETLQFQETRSVDVAPGRTTTVRLEAPKVAVSANARPWADVLVDGVSVGQTPIANLQLTIGEHDVVFRNPQFGERRQTVVVTARGPNRIAIDLSR